MDSKETCAGAWFAECEDAVGKRSCRIFGRAEGGKKQYRKLVVIVFDVDGMCGRERFGGKNKRAKKGWIRVWGGKS